MFERLDRRSSVFYVASVALLVVAIGSTAALAAEKSVAPLVDATRCVLGAIVEAAEKAPPAPRIGGVKSGDERTEHLVRQAAATAKNLPPETSARAFLLALGLGLDDSDVMRINPLLGPLVKQIESDKEREKRLAVLGAPTIQGRRDLVKHFAVSAALAAQLGPEAAETLGIYKEVRDSNGGTGFSFIDLAADLAGVSFARHVEQGQPTLEHLAATFTIDAFMPSTQGLQEGFTSTAFAATYGSTADDRFLRVVRNIREQIAILAGYRKEAHE